MIDQSDYGFAIDEDEALQLRCGATLEDIGRWSRRFGNEMVGPGPSRVFGLDAAAAPPRNEPFVSHGGTPLPTGLETPGHDEGRGDAIVVGVARGERGHVVVTASRRTFGTEQRPYHRIWVGDRGCRDQGAAFPDGNRMRFSMEAILQDAGRHPPSATVRGSFAVDANGVPVEGSLEAAVEPIRSRTIDGVAPATPEPAEPVPGRDAEAAIAEAGRLARTVTFQDRMAAIRRQAQRAVATGGATIAENRGGRSYVVRVGPAEPARPGVRRR